MKIFQTEPEHEESQEILELRKKLESLETILRDLRHIIGHRRTMLKNADKKLQEFQDTIYAMLMEDEYPRKKYSFRREDRNKREESSEDAF